MYVILPLRAKISALGIKIKCRSTLGERQQQCKGGKAGPCCGVTGAGGEGPAKRTPGLPVRGGEECPEQAQRQENLQDATSVGRLWAGVVRE